MKIPGLPHDDSPLSGRIPPEVSETRYRAEAMPCPGSRRSGIPEPNAPSAQETIPHLSAGGRIGLPGSTLSPVRAPVAAMRSLVGAAVWSTETPLYQAVQPSTAASGRGPRLLPSLALGMLIAAFIAISLGQGFVASTKINTDTPVSHTASDVEDSRVGLLAVLSNSANMPSPTVVSAPATATPATATPATRANPVISQQQVAAAEAALQTGEFEIMIDYSGGSRSSTTVRFDLGDGQRPQRMHIRTTYRAGTGARTTERIVIGAQGWERQSGTGWVASTPRQTVRDEVESIFPHVGPTPAILAVGGDRALLRWRDDAHGSETTLTVDLATGMPLGLQREAGDLEMITSVIYRGWDTPVNITAPGGD